MGRTPLVQGFYDKRTGSIQYVAAAAATRRCAIIDPVLNYDEKSGMTATRSADAILDYIEQQGYTVEWILDTHPHADHLSAVSYLKSQTGAPIAIGEKIVDIQKLWMDFYNTPDLAQDGSQWDRLFADGDVFSVGEIPARVIFSPGHTMASVTYVIGDAAFIHDTLFMPDSGSARADFPGGDAEALWHSIQAILALPDETRLFTGHDYQPGGREACWESTVAEQRARNIHLTAHAGREAYVAARRARDRTLPIPRLMLHALQINCAAGGMPPPESNGQRYLKIPLNLLSAPWE